MTLRTFARAGATTLFAAGSIALAAGPALAAPAAVDFGLSLKGTTIAADAAGKFGTIGFTNNGTGTPEEVQVLFDATGLDEAKVKVDLGDCTFVDGIADCVIDADSIPAPGRTADLALPLVKVDGAAGSAGKLTITVKVEGDTVRANDSRTVDVKVGAHGVDLQLVADDVTVVDARGESTGKAIPPGGRSLVNGFFVNQGDRGAVGFKLSVTVPEHVTFAEFEGCQLSNGKRTLTCVDPDVLLTPADVDESQSAIRFGLPVTVSKSAKGPISLKGGTATVSSLGAEDVPDASRARRAAEALPQGFARVSADQAADIDPTDNTDGFAVLVAGADGGHGGGDTGGGDTGGGSTGGGSTGGLPVTGPVAATVGGAGLAVLLAGVALFFVSRRRRVVLVTPTDGR